MSDHMSRGTSTSTALVPQQERRFKLEAAFSKRYPDYVLFVRFVPEAEIAQYELPHAGYAAFNSEGEIKDHHRSLEAVREWIFAEDCEPVWMH